MIPLVLAHASRQLPAELTQGTRVHQLSSFTERKALDQALRDIKSAERLIVVPAHSAHADSDLAAVLTRLMRREQLAIPVAYLPVEHTCCSRTHALSLNTQSALTSTAQPRPLIRDDDGVALAGQASIVGPEGGHFIGESIVDDTRLRLGTLTCVMIRVTAQPPGLRACVRRTGIAHYYPSRWISGRASQTGSDAMRVVRDGVQAPRIRTRITFYRHLEDWLLIP